MNEIDTVNISGDEMAMSNDQMIPSVISYSPAGENQERQWRSSLSSNAVAVHPMLVLDLRDNSGESDLISEALDRMRNLEFQYIRAS